MKLRMGLIGATMVLGVLLLSGVVLAVTKTCNNNCKGTNSHDSLVGSNSKNKIHALGGGDVVQGLRGTDWLYGEGGADELSGGPGVDGVYGGTGYDWLNGKKGNDYVKDIEESGTYSTTARKKQRKVDVLIGDRGKDTIRARDGNRDIVRGGPGYDKAYVDRVDKVKGVEKEVVPGGGGTGGTPQPNPNPVAPQKKQCEDGKDNDNDGKIDFGNGANNDPGCDSATDDTESPDPTPKGECEDGKDNDNDGKIDFGNGANNDPGCDSATDDSENVPPVAKDDELTTTAPDPEDINVILGGTMLNKDDDDTDADGHNLSVSEFTEPSHGTVERDATSNEILLYTPEDGFPSCTTNPCPDGTDSFDYTVSDGHGGTDTGTVHVTVYPPSGQ